MSIIPIISPIDATADNVNNTSSCFMVFFRTQKTFYFGHVTWDGLVNGDGLVDGQGCQMFSLEGTVSIGTEIAPSIRSFWYILLSIFCCWLGMGIWLGQSLNMEEGMKGFKLGGHVPGHGYRNEIEHLNET